MLYQVPANVTSVDKTGSKCSESEDTLKVSWNAGNNFILNFAANNSKYDLSSFVITFNTSSLFNDSAGEFVMLYNNLSVLFIFRVCSLQIPVNQTVTVAYKLQNESFDIPFKFSYHCNDDQRLNGTDNSSYIVVSQVQFEAFRTSNTNEFAGAKDCKSNITPDIVPIAVGISLIALIVVVLIAYIVGRRRQQARGYLNIM